MFGDGDGDGGSDVASGLRAAAPPSGQKERKVADIPEKERLTRALVQFYDHRSKIDSLRPHQWNVLLSPEAKRADHVLLTSSTGSGKSLCMFTWILRALIEDPDATAIMMFPTQALLWGQARNLAESCRKARDKGVRKDDSPWDHGDRLVEQRLFEVDATSTSAYGGIASIAVPGDGMENATTHEIPWTIWFGKGIGASKNNQMEEHEMHDVFKSARLVLCTPDKGDASLWKVMGDSFTRNLACVAIDEVHICDNIVSF